MLIKPRMKTRLTAEFSPEYLEIIDESESHCGHVGYRAGGETHFRVIMRASSLAGKSRVARHRAVYACIKAELEERIHALALDITT
ncbi:MAG: BolA family transcriptional regulator [Rhodobacteraceae bacterium]|nr:BolA family transcriptional regulator [Paracoccaceae bacterium]